MEGERARTLKRGQDWFACSKVVRYGPCFCVTGQFPPLPGRMLLFVHMEKKSCVRSVPPSLPRILRVRCATAPLRPWKAGPPVPGLSSEAQLLWQSSKERARSVTAPAQKHPGSCGLPTCPALRGPGAPCRLNDVCCSPPSHPPPPAEFQ